MAEARRIDGASTCSAMLDLQKRGARSSSTTATTSAPRRRRPGVANAFDFPGFVPAYIRPLFCEGKGPVPLGRALRRPERHRRHRRGRPRGRSRTTRPSPAGSRSRASASQFQGLPARICWLGYGERAKMGLVFNDLVRTRRGEGAHRHRPRPPRRGLGRLAQPRDRGHARRLRRGRRLADPERAAQRRRRRDVGLGPPRRRRRHRLLDPRGHGRRRRRHAEGRARASSACSPPIPAWASCATPTPATSAPSRSPASAGVRIPMGR